MGEASSRVIGSNSADSRQEVRARLCRPAVFLRGVRWAWVERFRNGSALLPSILKDAAFAPPSSCGLDSTAALRAGRSQSASNQRSLREPAPAKVADAELQVNPLP